MLCDVPDKGQHEGLGDVWGLAHLAVCESCDSPHILSPRFFPTNSPHNRGFAEWESLAEKAVRME